MPESLAEHLSRFTPDGTGLDRDGLLFAAGRASAHPNRAWAALTGTLAACQLLTLVFLWPVPTPPSGARALAPPAQGSVAWPAPPRADAAELYALNRRLLQSEGGDLPPPDTVDSIVPDDPPLYAFAGRSLAALD